MDIKELTFKEKTKLLAGKNGWQLEDLGGKLITINLSDGPLGVRKTSTLAYDENAFKAKDIPSIAYPSMQVASQSWDNELLKLFGEALADDCIERDVDVLLGPGVNIKRSPLCGRNFEYFSEDPYLTGNLAKSYIEGLQEKHIGATLKHYLANNNEIGRMWASSNVDERTLREIYMRPFEIALKAHPWAVMSSYNLVNGVRVSESEKLVRALREELHHGDNLVMSDWEAVKNHTLSIKAGTDLEMPYNESHYNSLIEDYNKGLINDKEIDLCVSRVLSFNALVKNEKQKRKVTRTIDERYEIATKIAEEGIVLLKNNGVLPLKNGQSLAITQQDFSRYYAGNGSSRVTPLNKVEILPDALKRLMNKSQIDVASMWGNNNEYVLSFTNADNKDVSIVMVGFEMGEATDRRNYSLKNYDNEDWFIKTIASHNKNTVVVLFGGASVSVSEWIDDVAALLYVGYPGEKGATAIANILLGKVNPSGKLTETFAKELSDYPSENIYFDGLNYNYLEKMDVGYRYFDKCVDKIRFPFGFGLSYTSFSYSSLLIDKKDNKVEVTFEVHNEGPCDGDEISQVYVSSQDSKVEKPIKELRGYARTFVKKNRMAKVKILLDDNSFSHYDPIKKKWVVDKGEYQILIGTNSQDIRLKSLVKI